MESLVVDRAILFAGTSLEICWWLCRRIGTMRIYLLALVLIMKSSRKALIFISLVGVSVRICAAKYDGPGMPILSLTIFQLVRPSNMCFSLLNDERDGGNRVDSCGLSFNHSF